MSLRPLLSIVALVGLASPAWSAERVEPAQGAKLDFNRDVKPILAEHCIKCHGPDEAEGGLNLADRASAVKELESGAKAVVAGRSAESELIKRVMSADAEVRMPPGDEKPLKPAEIAILKRWIDAGAEYQTHWSFQELKQPAAPAVKNAAAIRNEIDSFVVAELESRKIQPSPEADPRTLVKRLYLDLVGLLPTPEESDAFVKAYIGSKAKQSAAYEALVDRLLASPHYGERWGRHWLDLARYADSDGYEKDRPRPDAYVFRDWVIKAFNENMPFDRFTIEQLAGDLLPNPTPQDKIATAFNRQTLTNTEGGTDQEEFRVAACMDRTDTVGSVWLGLTVGCAKCHTHKYDPITHTEYYQLFAFFNGADEVVEKLPVKAKDLDALEKRLQPLEAALDKRYREIAPAEQKWEDEQRNYVENLKSSKLKVDKRDVVAEIRSAGGLKFAKQNDSYRVDGEKIPATDVYTILLHDLPQDLTGFRLEVFPDESRPKKQVGLSSGGNFVITNLRAEAIDSQGRTLRSVPLQFATADFEQQGYKAADVLTPAGTKKGWAVSGQVEKPHYLQVRTKKPLSLADGERLQLVVEQKYGAQHLLARLSVRAVTGDGELLHIPDEVVKALRMYPEKRVNETRQLLFDFFADQDAEVKRLKGEIDQVNKEFQTQLMPVRLIATSRKGRKTYRFDRGDFLSPKEEVAAGTLGILPPLGVDGKAPTRLDLAKWLVGPTNQLTPRVIANQFWSRLFGAGLVRSVGDFGVRGETPSHPELLDWLATTFRDDVKWDVKRFIKTIVMSATYRQASTHRPELVDVDPLNTLLARQNRLRVEGEIVRDLALEVGGLLSAKIGGPSVYPPMPADLAKLSYAGNFSWTESTGEDRYRRGMYTFFKRTIPHPTLMTFDCPDANLTCVNRSISNTPLQALTLLNNDAFVESSQSLAKKLLALDDLGDDVRLGRAIEICLAREPQSDEVDRLQNLLEQARRYYADHVEEADALVGRYAAAPTPNVETASWIAAVRVLINLDEFITRE
jgi:mono/diheme cytochrome c family protein